MSDWRDPSHWDAPNYYFHGGRDEFDYYVDQGGQYLGNYHETAPPTMEEMKAYYFQDRLGPQSTFFDRFPSDNTVKQYYWQSHVPIWEQETTYSSQANPYWSEIEKLKANKQTVPKWMYRPFDPATAPWAERYFQQQNNVDWSRGHPDLDPDVSVPPMDYPAPPPPTPLLPPPPPPSTPSSSNRPSEQPLTFIGAGR